MKKFILLAALTSLAVSGIAQGKSQKKQQTKTVKAESKSNPHTRDINSNDGRTNGHDNTYQSGQNTTAKYSKNLPANVNSSFTRDYPGVSNVTWTKSQGSWIATFPNGYYRTSVTYAANGQRTNTSRRRVRL